MQKWKKKIAHHQLKRFRECKRNGLDGCTSWRKKSGKVNTQKKKPKDTARRRAEMKEDEKWWTI